MKGGIPAKIEIGINLDFDIHPFLTRFEGDIGYMPHFQPSVKDTSTGNKPAHVLKADNVGCSVGVAHVSQIQPNDRPN